jgi:hypothetical protein
MDEHRALEAHHLDAVLVDAARQDSDNPLRRAALRLALMEDGALGIERVAGEDRMGRFHLVLAEIGDDLGADCTHAHAREQRQREGRVDKRLLPLRLGSIGRVEMDRLDVQRQQREPGIVGIEDGAAGAMLDPTTL